MSEPVKTKKKLIEVALPLDAVNRGCEEDKNRKTGHIRNLHKWFAPMPLPSWRAMIFAAVVDDPGEYLPEETAEAERDRLLDLVARLSSFDAHKDHALIEQARAEIARAVGSEGVTVVDPFCGGGSTLVEAQRLGLASRASDLNPVPVLITTVLCRVPGLFANRAAVGPVVNRDLVREHSGLAAFKADVAYYASKVRELAYGVLEKHYPKVDDAVPFAYRWAWTVSSPDPAAQGKHTPLVSNWWLSRHRNLRAWVEPVPQDNNIRFIVQRDGEAPAATTGRSGATCLFSKTPIPFEYIRQEGRAGKLQQSLFAIGARSNNETLYVAPDTTQIMAATEVHSAQVPGITLPDAALGFRVQQYGLTNFLDLFTKRQAHTLLTFAHLIPTVHKQIVADAVAAGLTNDDVGLEAGGNGARAYADSVAAVLGLGVGKMAQSNNILVRWFIDPRNGSGKATPAFDRHAIPMVWDFVETNPFGGSVGDWSGPVLETALRAFDLLVTDAPPAVVVQEDARIAAAHLPANSLIATDPPYFANIGYADLSDFFYLWLREALRPIFPELFRTIATPKEHELIATPFRHGGSADRANEYFRTGFAEVFQPLAERADARFPFLIVYAIKQAEEADEDTLHSTGWEVFLGGLVDAGLAIVATWPVRTTTDTRMIGIETNALASAIFVVGRRRPAEAKLATRAEFTAALKRELPKALRHLQHGNIAPVDLAQAAIGPGMAVYTRYAKVLDASGRPVSVKEALALINQALDEVLTEQEGDFDADTRWALAWFEQSGFDAGDYGVAETLSKAKNTSVQGMKDAGILDKKSPGGKVRLLRPSELPSDWDPVHDPRLTVWEVVHHLVRRLESGGEAGAAELVSVLGGVAEVARELAYRLYTICERKKRAPEALFYNALVQSWPEISRLAREKRPPQAAQAQMFQQE